MRTLLVVMWAMLASPAFAAETPLLRDGDRVVFVGDSITGLSRNDTRGFVHQMESALRETGRGQSIKLIPLGGSGQGVATWIEVEKRSRTEEFHLDVPDVFVKSTLDQPADVVVFMLGMNDVLAPYLSDKPVELDAWAKNYRTLVKAVRDRIKPRIVAIATMTLCSEDPDSPRNRFGAELNRRAVQMASEDGFIVIPTGAQMLEMLRSGREHQPDFHVTYDWVHPNLAGHVAIATAVLRSFGESVAAAKLEEKHLPEIFSANKTPRLSWSVTPLAATPDNATQRFEVRYFWNDDSSTASPEVSLVAPTAWQVTPAKLMGDTGTISVSGDSFPLQTELQLVARVNGRKRTSVGVSLAAPWLIGTGIVNSAAWPNMKYDPRKGAMPWDAEISQGKNWGVTGNAGLVWSRYYPSVDFTGNGAPGSIDFTAVTVGLPCEAAYAGRWIHSERNRHAQLELASGGFSGNIGLQVWINGEEKFASAITEAPNRRASVDVGLRRGWNCLVARSDHYTWQWHVSIDLKGINGDDLADLRYAATPKPPADDR